MRPSFKQTMCGYKRLTKGKYDYRKHRGAGTTLLDQHIFVIGSSLAVNCHVYAAIGGLQPALDFRY
jgi:hypothetical protein